MTRRHDIPPESRSADGAFEAVFRQNAVGVLEVEPESGRIVSANRRFYEIFGCSGDDASHFLDAMISGDDLAAYRREVSHLLEGRSDECTIELRSAVATRWIALTLSRISRSGNPVACIGIVRDLSTRKRAEEALHISEAQFRNIFEEAPAGIFQSTLSGRFISVNAKLAELFGYSSPAEMRDTVTDIARQIFIDGRKRREIMERATASPSYVQLEVEYRRRDGSVFIANLYMRAVRDDSGEVAFMEGFVEDITERKNAEAALRAYQDNLERLVEERTAALEESNRRLKLAIEVRIAVEEQLLAREAQYRDLVESANSVILRWRPDGTVTFFNTFARDFFGYSESEILGRSIIGTIVPMTETTGRDLSTLATDVVRDPGVFVRSVNENMRKNGERVWVAWTNKPIFDAAGEVEEILSIGVDITQLVATERELRITLDDLARAKERAEQADRIKSAFLATMSHELRTPLNSIIGFTGIILQGMVGPLNDEQKKQLGMVQESARHLLSLIGDILDISKIEAGQLQLACEDFDLADSIRRTVASVRPIADRKGLALQLETARDVGAITSDRRRVEQIFLNLLSNAVKFTAAGTVAVQCRRDGGEYLTEVSDTGIGIAAADIDSIFTPFHQVDSGLTRKFEGTGLGLSISRKLAGLLGGSIGVNSTPGQGSTFWVRIPAPRDEE